MRYNVGMNIGDLKKQLWAVADKLRGNISPSDYKYVVLGLIFLKYVSDAFDRQHQKAIDDGFTSDVGMHDHAMRHNSGASFNHIWRRYYEVGHF